MKLIKKYLTGGTVDMTKVGHGAEKNPNYYIDNSMNPLPEVTVTGDALKNNNRIYRSSFNPNGAEEFLDATGLGLVYNPFRYTREILNFDKNPKLAFNGVVEASIPFSAPARVVYGATKLADKNGIKKTYNLLSNGQYGKAALSGVGDVFNAAMTGEGSRTSLNTLAEGANNIERRGIETLMRTSQSYNPFIPVKNGITDMLKGKAGGVDRIAHISDYILRGKKVGPKGYYNSFAPFNSLNFSAMIDKPYLQDRLLDFKHPIGRSYAYSGFFDYNGYIPEMTEKNDIIDAYLYNKDIDPSFNVKKVATGNDFGYHTDYIKLNYRNKMSNIPVYEVDGTEVYPNSEVIPSNTWKGIDNKRFGNNDSLLNVAGRMITLGTTTGGIPVEMQLDIWKFNPLDYFQKWIKPADMFHAPILRSMQNFIIKKGLKEVDRLGTPVVTRTKWTRLLY